MKKQIAFRIEPELFKIIYEKAKAEKRSINNYIEYVLYRHLGNIPNEVTKQAIFEAENNINLSPINVTWTHTKSYYTPSSIKPEFLCMSFSSYFR